MSWWTPRMSRRSARRGPARCTSALCTPASGSTRRTPRYKQLMRDTLCAPHMLVSDPGTGTTICVPVRRPSAGGHWCGPSGLTAHTGAWLCNCLQKLRLHNMAPGAQDATTCCKQTLLHYSVTHTQGADRQSPRRTLLNPTRRVGSSITPYN